MWILMTLVAVAATFGGLFVFYRGAYKRFKALFEAEQETVRLVVERQNQLEEVAKYQYDKIREYEDEKVDNASAGDIADGFNELSKKGNGYGPN